MTAALIATAALAHAAAAQSPSFQYLIQAPASLNPGQTATVTVLCGFTPGVGGAVTISAGTQGNVLGLSSGRFAIDATGGDWSDTVGIAPYNFLPGVASMPGTVAGSGVSNITWANGFPPPMAAVSTVNPTPLWQATFTAPASPGAVQLTLTPEGPHAVWASFGSFLATEVISLNTAGAAATIVVGTPCYPDCTEDGALTVADFGCFQTRFAAGNPYADCNADGSLTVADFGCFQTQFVAGCP